MEKFGASFKDPSGFIVHHNGEFLRVIQPVYREHYEFFLKSGLYQKLVDERLLVSHEEISIEKDIFPGAYKILRPQQLSFISYPYEWSFSQLKDAALATLKIQKIAIQYGMSLKDATAFNIQFVDGHPILIDTLSFEKLPANKPWVAYAQFCRHFLAPLALMSYRDVRLGQLLRVYLDGIPLDLTTNLLPRRSRLNVWVLVHLHLHVSSQQKLGNRTLDKAAPLKKYGLNSLRGLVSSLESSIRGLKWQPAKAVWGNYYEATVTGGKYVEHKKELVDQLIKKADPKSVWDLGSNTGVFSRLAASQGISTISFDGDPDCVEINYLESRRKQEIFLLPLLMDLTNPSPALGWQNSERMSWLERTKPDLVLSLALVHHLAIGNNLPLEKIVTFFRGLSLWLIIEFVPKSDANAQKLLRVREDIFVNYTQNDFELEFSRGFTIEQSCPIEDSERTLYLMRRQ